jgi:hypothetical protein
MRLLPAPSAAHIVLLTAAAALLFRSERAGLALVGRFPAHAPGRADFVRGLRGRAALPLYLVADLVEEAFAVERVPALRWPHRAALHARKLARLFPDTPYCRARVLGRTATGRREDIVRFSALSDGEQLSPWLAAVKESRAPLAGITSLALLAEALAARRHGQAERLLLASLDEESGLRQSYLEHGRLRFSRLLPGFCAGGSASLSAALAEEGVRIRQYLERRKLLAPQQALETEVYLAAGPYARCLAGQQGLVAMHLHDASLLLAEEGCGEQGLPAASALFLRAAAWPLSRLDNHYAPAALLGLHRCRRLCRGLLPVAALVALLGAGAAFFLQRQGAAMAEESKELRARTQLLKEERDALQSVLPEPPALVREMAARVALAEALGRAPSPLLMMAEVSQALAASPQIRLHSFVWQLGPGGEEGAAAARQPLPPAAMLAALTEGRATSSLLLAGSVVRAAGPREAQEAVADFAALLAEVTGLQLTREKMPIETRGAAGLQTSVAAGSGRHEGAFLLRLAGRRGT